MKVSSLARLALEGFLFSFLKVSGATLHAERPPSILQLVSPVTKFPKVGAFNNANSANSEKSAFRRCK